ncbi:MAG: hypothetical protein SFV22_13875 [Saprospiraceae bacterium]|nr:hypothetical protein [Saprospiraceae bacterium]
MFAQRHLSRIAELAARWYVFVMIGLYGLGKIAGGQFYRHGHLPEKIAHKTVAELGAFELAWTFFGYSQAYILFIGLAQISGGLLLLAERTKLLGVAILMPVLINIIVVDAVYEVKDAIMSAAFYLFLLCLILYFNRQKVLGAIRVLTMPLYPDKADMKSAVLRIVAVAACLVLFFFAETFVLKMVGFSRL